MRVDHFELEGNTLIRSNELLPLLGDDHGSGGADDSPGSSVSALPAAQAGLAAQLATLSSFLLQDPVHAGLQARNSSLTSPGPISLYTLELVNIVAQDQDDRFWRRLIEQFIIWEDDEETGSP